MKTLKMKIKNIQNKYAYPIGLFYFFGTIILFVAFIIKQNFFA